MHTALSKKWLLAVLLSIALAGCGGGSGTDNVASSTAAASAAPTPEPGAPQATGNIATDGFNWFNFRRTQVGLASVTRNNRIDTAALGHSRYQATNNVISHEQTRTDADFTGATLGERLANAGYELGTAGYMYGEIISSTSYTSGFRSAEELIAAIYHRFVAFEPMFKEAGSGAVTSARGMTYFTTNFGAVGLDRGLGASDIVTYPFNGQQQVPQNFQSDNELPDPVPEQNEVGYPISVHANVTSTVQVESFTIQPRGSAALPVRLLTAGTDRYTPSSAASIIPLVPLAPATTYEVTFRGLIDNRAVSRTWTFVTQS
ncbi:CAP domain-containing protein [Noviherbaspirillum sp. CPCC 100848]|uniref:CAP domain-containing protein n=1 Tax=Noviherbaspirillum album TaxID=3080276 RepID=A0ABU6JGS2_9BURK|nr:CAP domain-containing protein [Noviherbaspirillum sp. CPCC 100848]MEC4722861.1 CAP domain-containing protein [Noviherbaspirillum sp. CPCC 100848]